MNTKAAFLIMALIALGVTVALVTMDKAVFAHCDTLDGPVVKEAQLALEKGDVTGLLKWVRKEREQEIRDAFARSLAVRVKGKEARELADKFFFETLVRVHRSGEGAPFTGLKPAGSVEAAVAAADKALQAGSVDELAAKIGNAVGNEIKKRFIEVIEKKKHGEDSVEAGREFVEA